MRKRRPRIDASAIVPGEAFLYCGSECRVIRIVRHGRARWVVANFENRGISKVGINAFCDRALPLGSDGHVTVGGQP